jgi:hypothetical protein
LIVQIKEEQRVLADDRSSSPGVACHDPSDPVPGLIQISCRITAVRLDVE